MKPCTIGDDTLFDRTRPRVGIAPQVSLAPLELVGEDARRKMAEVLFTYTGQLATAAGVAEEWVAVDPAATLRSVIDGLALQRGPSFRDLVLDSGGRLRSTLLVMFDGVQAPADRESRTLAGVKTVMLMTPIAGG